MADRTALRRTVRYSCRPLSGIAVVIKQECLLIYSFKLKSAFDPCQRFVRSLCLLSAFSHDDIRCVLWLNDTSYSKMSEEVNRKFPAIGTRRYNFQPATSTDPARYNAQGHRRTDWQTDDSIMLIADHTAWAVRSANKKALLSQRRPRDAPNIWVPWKVSRVLANAPGYFSRNL